MIRALVAAVETEDDESRALGVEEIRRSTNATIAAG
jgi:hypothetical protein